MDAAATLPNIIVIGTGDTKSDELQFMASVIRHAGGRPIMVDVSILADPAYRPDFGRRDIAAAAAVSIDAIIADGDESRAMTLMARGAVALVRDLHRAGKVDGVIMLGGSMGTDLALDVAAALPIGVPKLLVSTIAYSHLIPPERIAPDLMMILWSGGLYGLNDICRAILSQACGAVVGAARHGTKPVPARPVIGMTSLGSACLSYMKFLKPALERRGYEVAIFHTTGMGGRAFEALATQGGFAAVLDFCIQEVSNHHFGSIVTSGPDRLENAGRAGIPQIIAPGAIDMVDLPAWRDPPAMFANRPFHAHNRLIGSVSTAPQARRAIARVIASKLGRATGKTAFLLPTEGLQAWDLPGEPFHDPAGHAAFLDEIRQAMPANVDLVEVDAHINARAFAEKALEILDDWVSQGIVAEGRP